MTMKSNNIIINKDKLDFVILMTLLIILVGATLSTTEISADTKLIAAPLYLISAMLLGMQFGGLNK